MHGAPSVSYPVGRSRLAGALVLAAWTAGLLACLAFAWQGAPPARLAIAAAACIGAGAWALRWWLRQPAGLLAWDGSAWTWSGGGPAIEAGAVQVALDLQSLMLLRWQAPEAALRLVWVERARLPARWDALRRAVYSRADPEAPSRAAPPATP